MRRPLSSGNSAGAYLTGPVMPNPTLLGYSAEFGMTTPARPMSFPQTTTFQTQEAEFSDQDVTDAIQRLTKSPGSSPEALQQAALDMELIISHFDSLSTVFGAEAALTSLALDLASQGKAMPPRKKGVPPLAPHRDERKTRATPSRKKSLRSLDARPKTSHPAKVLAAKGSCRSLDS